MVILKVCERTLEEVFHTLESHGEYFDGFELDAGFLQDPAQEDWNRIRSLTRGLRILSLPRTISTLPASSIELYRSILKKGIFDMVRLEYEKYPGNENIRASLEQDAYRNGAGVIRAVRIQSLDGKDVAGRGLDSLQQGLSAERDVLHVTMSPAGWKEIASLMERFLLPLRGQKQEIRRSFLVEGPWGFPFQVLATWLGSYFTYTSPRGRGPLVDPVTLHTVYRYPALGERTSLFGIIGNPVLHSRSPYLHNRGYEFLGLDAVYVPFPVDQLESFFPVARKFGIRGLSVTIPHKEGVLKYCDWCEEAVHAVGACNTLVFSEDGIKGYNTDVEGFLAPLNEFFPRLGGVRALVIGAGGASRSVVYGLAREGARVLVLNRTVERAESLVKEMEKTLHLQPGILEVGSLDQEAIAKAEQFRPDLVVQSTSCGMHPREAEDPFPSYPFRGEEVVYDLVYAPRETRFLKHAREAGCKVIYGDSMLVHQAFRQFLLFTGREYPRQLIDGM
ncbi:MAG: hypothetical protein Kow009_14470 [Spirochaetales bacterium]